MRYIVCLLVWNSKALTIPPENSADTVLVWPNAFDLTPEPYDPYASVVSVFPASGASSSPFESRSKLSLWVPCGNVTSPCVCEGIVRVGFPAGDNFTAPVTVFGSIPKCSLQSVRLFLWNDFPNRIGWCQQLTFEPFQLFSEDFGCLQTPPPGSLWTGPGLAASCEGKGWVYHAFSGQIRQGGLCLTAKRPPDAFPAGGDSEWLPWNVFLLPCSNAVTPDERQSWDLPQGAIFGDGQLGSLTFAAASNLPGGVTGWRVGSKGSIKLRESVDIGSRCLEISSESNDLPLRVPAVFMQAALCNDPIRKKKLQIAAYRFLGTHLTNGWTDCTDESCSQCLAADCLMRYSFGSSYTQPVSDDGSVGSAVCSFDFLQNMALPDVGSDLCECQAVPSDNSALTKLRGTYGSSTNGDSWVPGRLVAGCADDVPSTPSLGLLN